MFLKTRCRLVFAVCKSKTDPRPRFIEDNGENYQQHTTVVEFGMFKTLKKCIIFLQRQRDGWLHVESPCMYVCAVASTCRGEHLFFPGLREDRLLYKLNDVNAANAVCVTDSRIFREHTRRVRKTHRPEFSPINHTYR